MQQKIPLILSAVVFILVVVFSFQNPQNVSFQVFSLKTDLPQAAIMLATFFLGLAPALSFGLVRKQKQVVSNAKVEEWEKQDRKLTDEIESDKVKQLEAKIETLEIALKSALTKKK